MVTLCVIDRTFVDLLADWWWLGVVVSVVGRINEVNQHRARLVLGWVTVSGLANHLGVNQPPRSTQPGHSFVGRQYQ